MYYLRDHGQRLHRTGADARGQQQFRKIQWTALCGGRQCAVQAAGKNVGGADIMMGGHDEVR